MPKRQILTVEELKSLLLAYFKAVQSNHAKLQARLQQALGTGVKEEKPGDVAINNKIHDWLSDVIAHRLKRNRRTVPLISSRDLVRFFPTLLNIIEQEGGGELNAEDRKAIDKFFKAMSENVFKMAQGMVLEGKDPYEEYWRVVNIVLDLAVRRGVMPTEFLSLEGATDAVTRRLFSKKQFFSFTKKNVSKFTDAETLKRIIIQPILDLVVGVVGEEERRAMEQELETELMPQLRENIEKSKVVINAWLDEEVARIYASM